MFSFSRYRAIIIPYKCTRWITVRQQFQAFEDVSYFDDYEL
jgi:hypothetical protein